MSMFSNYDQRLLDHVTKLHFIGCGGSGMFPLIQILAAKGYQITGSDVLDGSIIQAERAMGIRVTLGHDANNIVGADMVVGSLIKNPGGGLAPIGGYICGTQACVDRCAYRLSAPGLGQEVGANLGILPAFYQGFFLAPTVTAGALKGAIFASELYEGLGFRCVPSAGEARSDIIQAVELGSEAAMLAFCKGIQAAAPVDSFAAPIPGDMPGYESKVIMAAGAFIQGASIELSCDAPMREPYTAYLQGGLTYESGKAGVMLAVEELLRGE